MKTLVEFDDLPLAAYLHLQGFRIVKIRTKKDKQGWGVFAFSHEKGIERSVAGFYANQASVEPRAYILKMRDLKDLVREIVET
jgi:hypothetical protein